MLNTMTCWAGTCILMAWVDIIKNDHNYPCCKTYSTQRKKKDQVSHAGCWVIRNSPSSPHYHLHAAQNQRGKSFTQTEIQTWNKEELQHLCLLEVLMFSSLWSFVLCPFPPLLDGCLRIFVSITTCIIHSGIWSHHQQRTHVPDPCKIAEQTISRNLWIFGSIQHSGPEGMIFD